MSDRMKFRPYQKDARCAHERHAHTHGPLAAVTPPADTPQAKLAQTKSARTGWAAQDVRPAVAQAKRPAAAPPVYRPQPTPQVLQMATPQGFAAKTPQAAPPRPAHSRPSPAAPPAYTPEHKSIVQPKAAAHVPAQTRTQSPLAHAQRHARALPVPARVPQRPAVAQAKTPAALQMKPATRPFVSPRPSVIQRAQDEKKAPWPPPADPQKAFAASGGSLDYFKKAAQYFTDEQEWDTADAFMDFQGKMTGKSVGMSYGTGDGEFDASYIDIPDGVRPSAPASLWGVVYAGLKDYPKDAKWQYVSCQELCGKTVFVDAKTRVELNTKKRPPMCHIIAFNHIKWAVGWIHSNKTAPVVGGEYKGPDVAGFPNDTWRDLVWNKFNLRPGHANCNSRTAADAKGEPATQSAQNTVLAYVVKGLKTLKPTWF